MKQFTSNLKQQFKIFFKSKILLILYGVMFITTVVPLGYFMTLGADTSYNFYIVCRFIFYETALFMLISFVYLTLDRKNNISESIMAITHNKKSYILNCVSVLTILLFIYNLFLLCIIIFNLAINNEFIYVSNAYIISYLMNVLLPQVVCFLITIMLSSLKNMKVSSILLIFTILLFSPYINVLEWQYPPFIPIDKVVNVIQLPFSLFLQHAEYSLDPLYGYQNEIYKLWLLLFWGIIFLFVYYREYFIKNKKVIPLVALIIVCIGYNIYKPQNIYRLNYKWDDTYDDYNYYGIKDDKLVYLDKKSNATISTYNLNVDLKEKLYVSGDIDMQSDEETDEIIMTLYRNYSIKNINSDHLKSYKQDGDYITLKFDKKLKSEKIKFSYSGTHPVLFSNYQAVQLPGYFAWYPMLGEKSLYFNNNQVGTTTYGFNPYNRVDKAQFNVNINSNYDIICNLEAGVKKSFKGESDSLTLIGGNVELLNDNKYSFINYFPQKLNMNYPLKQYSLDLNDSIDELKKTFKVVFGTDINDFEDKKIMLCSNALIRTQESGGFAEFKDYILVSDNVAIRIKPYIGYKINNRFDINPVLIDTLNAVDLWSGDSEVILGNILQYIDYNYSTSSSSDREENQLMARKYKELKDELDAYISKHGKKETMKYLGRIILGAGHENSH